MILLVLAGVSTAAPGSTWLQAGTGKDQTRVMVDTSSITMTGAIRRAWLKMIFPAHTQPGFGDNRDKWVDFNLNHSAFNCTEGTSRTEALVDNFSDGTHQEVPADELAGDSWERVPPDTALAAVMKLVCDWK